MQPFDSVDAQAVDEQKEDPEFFRAHSSLLDAFFMIADNNEAGENEAGPDHALNLLLTTLYCHDYYADEVEGLEGLDIYTRV